jgi:hypothetical protein
MVDYYALISPTIEPLADASPDERKVVYERLVLMLDQQLRAAEPPRSDKEILKERINLEAAIRRVERGILNSRKKNTAVEPKPIPAPPPPPEPRNISLEVPVQKPEPKRQEPKLQEPEPQDPKQPIAEQQLPEQLEPVVITPPPIAEPPPAPPEPEPVAIPIAIEEPVIVPVVPTETIDPIPMVAEALPLDEMIPVEADMGMRPFYPAPLDESPADHETAETTIHDEIVATEADVFPELAQMAVEKPADLRPGLPSTGTSRPLSAGLTQQAKGLWLRIGILALVILALASAIGGIAEYLAQRSAEHAINRSQTPATEVATTDEKILDRLPMVADEAPKAGAAPTGAQMAGGPSQSTDGTDPDILIQRAILLEEPPGGVGDPKRTEGRVSWKLETLRSTLANTSDIGARATIDLTDAGLNASFVFRRNRDQSSANTHLIEISMSLSPDNPNGKIRDISVPELRVDEKTRGTSLAGIAVPVADNVFLIGLNGLPADMQRNIDLLRNRSWFLVPLRYSNGKRALLMFEKGKPGERVFEDAMQTWQ